VKVFVPVFPILALSLAIFACSLGGLQYKRYDPRDDTQSYLVDIAAALGNEWTPAIIRSRKNGDPMYIDGSFDPVRHAIGRAEYSTHHQGNSLAFFRQTIALFEEESRVDDYFDDGGSLQFNRSSFRNLDLAPEGAFKADEYQIQCSNRPTVTHCIARFRYENYIVLVNAFTVRDSVQYLSKNDFIALLTLIDRRMSSRRALDLRQ